MTKTLTREDVVRIREEWDGFAPGPGERKKEQEEVIAACDFALSLTPQTPEEVAQDYEAVLQTMGFACILDERMDAARTRLARLRDWAARAQALEAEVADLHAQCEGHDERARQAVAERDAARQEVERLTERVDGLTRSLKASLANTEEAQEANKRLADGLANAADDAAQLRERVVTLEREREESMATASELEQTARVNHGKWRRSEARAEAAERRGREYEDTLMQVGEALGLKNVTGPALVQAARNATQPTTAPAGLLEAAKESRTVLGNLSVFTTSVRLAAVRRLDTALAAYDAAKGGETREGHPTTAHATSVVTRLEEMLSAMDDGTLGRRDVVGRVGVLLEKARKWDAAATSIPAAVADIAAGMTGASYLPGNETRLLSGMKILNALLSGRVPEAGGREAHAASVAAVSMLYAHHARTSNGAPPPSRLVPTPAPDGQALAQQHSEWAKTDLGREVLAQPKSMTLVRGECMGTECESGAPTVGSHLMECPANSQVLVPTASRFARVDPDEDTADGKTTGFDDWGESAAPEFEESLRQPSTMEGSLKPASNAAPEVVWEGDGVQVLADGSFTCTAVAWHCADKVLARALSEAKRELAGSINPSALDAVRKTAAEAMRERCVAMVRGVVNIGTATKANLIEGLRSLKP